MSSKYLVTAEADDQPGIVASVTNGMSERGWNIEDASMTRLAGRFVMLLVVSTDSDVPADEVESAMRAYRGELTLRLSVEELASVSAVEPAGDPWALTVYGSDRPGIVAAITGALARHGVNIDDLSTRVIGDAEHPTYTMLIDATVPASVEKAGLISDLNEIGEQLDVACHAAPVDADVL